MGIARSTYYDTPEAKLDDTALVEAICAICDEFEAYGWRRVQAALRLQGIVVNHKKIRRLMREHDLQPKARRRFARTTNSDHDQPIFPDRTKELTVDLWSGPLGPDTGQGVNIPRRSTADRISLPGRTDLVRRDDRREWSISSCYGPCTCGTPRAAGRARRGRRSGR
jgi:transposase InsO family protein